MRLDASRTGYSDNMENEPPDPTRIQSFSLPVEPHEDKPEEKQDAVRADEEQAPAPPPASQDFPTRVQQIPPAPAAPGSTPSEPSYGQTPAYGQTPPPNQYGQYGQYGTPPPNYQQPYPQGYQQPPYGQPQQYGYGYGYGPPRTSGLAIASLICGIFGGFFGVAWIAALITGFMALKQIRERGETGRGMAIAGIVLGFLWLLGVIIFAIVIAVAASHSASVPNG